MKNFNNLKNNYTPLKEVLLYTYYHPCTTCAAVSIPGIKAELEKAYGTELQFTVVWSKEFKTKEEMKKALLDLIKANIRLIKLL